MEEDDEPFDEKMGRLIDKLSQQFQEADQLKAKITNNLKNFDFAK